MKEIIKIEKEHEVLSLVTDIAFADVPAWYGSTRTNLLMDVIMPKAAAGHEKMPAILWICGGAFLVRDKSVWLPEMLRFARAGYVVASIQYRTSNDVPFPAPLIDAKAAVRYLKAHAEQYCIDPDKIFAMGESAGATLASLLGTTIGEKAYDQGDFLEYDSSVAGVVDFYGLTDLFPVMGVKMEDGTNVPNYAMEAFVGPGYTSETLTNGSASKLVSEKTVPFMILHGSADQTVPIEQSDVMYAALEKQGIEADYLVVEGAAHGDDLFYQDVIIDRILAFLAKYTNR